MLSDERVWFECADAADVIPEHDEYRAMPHSLRHLLTPPTPRPHSSPPSSPYSRPRWSPDGTAVARARQSVSSIGSCSSTGPPIKSILTRHDSGVSMATTRRKKRRSPPSVKFVDVRHDNAVYHNTPPPSPPSKREHESPRWFSKWCKRSSNPPPRPTISGPYHLSYSASLVDVDAPRAPRPTPTPGRLKRLWHRLISIIA